MGGQEEYRSFREAVEEHKKKFSDFVRAQSAGGYGDLRLRQEAEVGIPYKKIVDKAARENVDLIVMCTHGRSGLPHAILGSVTEQVVRRAQCPVLTIPRPKKEKGR